MKTKERIEEQKRNDVEFIISAVTCELDSMVYLEYFATYENNGGMAWFFDECVDITHKIMFTEGSAYLKWLDHWIDTDDVKRCKSFSEVTNETCFDWYHMNEAKKEFQSRYNKDENIDEQVSERIGGLLNLFETEEHRDKIILDAVAYSKIQRNRKKMKEWTNRVKPIIDKLKEINVDGEEMQYILEEVGMDEQMYKQLDKFFNREF
tara:strand:+ start:3267 stop:3887 length:621 start_codon:yes stop_codon:yes gene_type:complete